MNVSALLTFAAIIVGSCVLLLLPYSILRKQPNNLSVYFGRRLSQASPRRRDPPCFHRFVPSPSWILRLGKLLKRIYWLLVAWMLLRVFSVAAFVCIFMVLLVNYYWQQMQHKKIPLESLEVFTIENAEEVSRWYYLQLFGIPWRLWAHCLALYIVTCSACLLLYSVLLDLDREDEHGRMEDIHQQLRSAYCQPTVNFH